MKVNTMMPDQTGPIKGSSLNCPYCLQYETPNLTKVHKQKRQQTTIVVNSGKRVNKSMQNSNILTKSK